MAEMAASSNPGRCVLITGVHGFIGIHTAAMALRMGTPVIGVDIASDSDRADRVRDSLGFPRVAAERVDLFDCEAVVRFLRDAQPHTVIHCAGSIERDAKKHMQSSHAADANAALAASLVQALTWLPQGQRPVLVTPGSQMEYGNAPLPWTEAGPCEPFNAYGAGKLAATQSILGAVERGMLRACVLRLPVVFGPGQRPVLFVPELICGALRREPMAMTDGTQRRAFLYVGDAAGLLLAAGQRAARDASFPALLNAPANPPRALLDVAHLIADALGARDLLRAGARPKRPGEPLDAWPDTALAASLGLGAATPLREALRRTIAWYRDHAHLVS